MFTVKEVKVGNSIMMLFWQLLQHEHKIAVQGTESNELHRYYLGPFHSSFAHEVQYHKLIPSLEIQPPLLNSEATFMSSSV